jgi:hypothetical protein
MSRIGRNISIILRSERLIARRRAAVAGRQIGMFVAAGVLGGMALVMLDVAAYLALAKQMDPAFAALWVAGINVVLAGVLVALARTMSAESDIEAVSEVRDMAVADLEGEVQEATSEMRELADNVRKLARDPFSGSGVGALASLLGTILKVSTK